MTRLAPRVFSPDGDARADRVVAGYRVDEPARVALYVDGAARGAEEGSEDRGHDRLVRRSGGEPLPQGPYELRLGAVDVAGNEGRQSRPEGRRDPVRRARPLAHRGASPGGRFAVLVLSDAARVTWRLGARTGVARPGTLRLRAPLQPGRFTLTVTANGRQRARRGVREEPGAVSVIGQLGERPRLRRPGVALRRAAP